LFVVAWAESLGTDNPLPLPLPGRQFARRAQM
jgi:hypothetical protein